jgi:SAM-dependent methyltransferase
MAISMDLSQESYTITGGEQGKRRLNLLAESFQPTTLRLLQDAGLRRDDRRLDLGCGGGHVVLDMARMVGPGGFVTGMGFDPQIIGLARMRQLARPGGPIVVEDIDVSGSYRHLYRRAHARSVGPYTAAVRRCGGEADLVLRHGLATDQEFDSILTRVYSFVQDPATLVALPRIVQIWGTA